MKKRRPKAASHNEKPAQREAVESNALGDHRAMLANRKKSRVSNVRRLGFHLMH
jgi:hypothetical protein